MGQVKSTPSVLHLNFHLVKHILCMVLLQDGHAEASLNISPKQIAHSSVIKGLKCFNFFLSQG